MELNIKGLNKDQKNLVYSIDEPLIVEDLEHVIFLLQMSVLRDSKHDFFVTRSRFFG